MSDHASAWLTMILRIWVVYLMIKAALGWGRK